MKLKPGVRMFSSLHTQLVQYTQVHTQVYIKYPLGCHVPPPTPNPPMLPMKHPCQTPSKAPSFLALPPMRIFLQSTSPMLCFPEV